MLQPGKSTGVSALPAQMMQEHPWRRGFLPLSGQRALASKAVGVFVCVCACGRVSALTPLSPAPKHLPFPSHQLLFQTDWLPQASELGRSITILGFSSISLQDTKL